MNLKNYKKMVNQNLKELKDLLQSWEESLLIRTVAYKQAREYLKTKEREHQQAKRLKNKCYKDHVEARKNIKKYQQSISSFQSRVRAWNKQNLGKIIK